MESLRSTGMAGQPAEFFQFLPATSQAPQPSEWFAGVEDPSITRLLDPFDPGTPDLASARTWRDYIRTVGRTPNGVWGGKLMWNQTSVLLSRAKNLPDRSGDGLRSAIRDVVGEEPLYIYVHRPDVVAQAVSFWRALQTRVWRGTPEPCRDARAQYHAGAIGHLVATLRAQDDGWRRWFAEEGINPIDVPYPLLARNLSQVAGTILKALALDPVPPPGPALQRQADERSREWVDRYRIDAVRFGLPR